MSQRITLPVLETTRLSLRVPTLQEFATYRNFMTSKRACMMGTLSKNGAWKEFTAEIGHWVLFGFGVWHMFRKTDHALVGATGVLHHAYYPEPELGWHLYDGFEGQGYATEAATAARDWTFAQHDMPSLVSYINPANDASVAVALRLGATHDPEAQSDNDLVYRHHRAGAS